MTTLVERAGGPRTMVGYCWPWTVRPGQRVDFMVSCERPERYRAELVRIICGDALSSEERFKEALIESTLSGDYAGRHQSTHLGSYVEISHDSAALNELCSFTVEAMVCPTLLPGGTRTRTGGVPNSSEVPVLHDQHLVSRWDAQNRHGWALFIDEQGRPTFMVGDYGSVRQAKLDCSLVQDRWFLVLGGVDVERGIIRIAAQSVGHAPGDLIAWPARVHDERDGVSPNVPQAGPLRLAACCDGPGNATRLKPAHCFNGRLDRVRMSRDLLNLDAATMLATAELPAVASQQIVGFWDFAKHLSGVYVVDQSENALHGVTVNAPTRGVRGVDWDGSISDWRVRPAHYSAIHFHDDDLYDAEWKVDFSFTVPEHFPSGIYAARIRQGDCEDYMPFFVASRKHRPRAPVAVLLPTMTYTAYTNVTGLTALKRKRRTLMSGGATAFIDEDIHPDVLQDADHARFLLEHHAQLGKGIYANHADGTLVSCASQRHPNMTIKPKGMNWTLVADTYLTAWLEHKQFAFDVITDDLLHEEGAELLKDYTVVITGNHPEYYTRRMLDAVDQYQRAGGRWMYLGGNGFYWVTSVHSQLPGLVEVRKEIYAGHPLQFENRHALDAENGGKWASNGRAPALLVGLSYETGKGYAMEGGAPYRRLPDSYHPDVSFIFDGVVAESIGNYGIFGNGAAGQEVDMHDPERGSPAHTLHLARAEGFANYGSTAAEHYKAGAKGPIADLLFFETPNGGAVFSVGSMSWTGALSHDGFANDISRLTENVLRRFLDKTPFASRRLKRAAEIDPLAR